MGRPGTLLLGPGARDDGTFLLSSGGMLQMSGIDTLSVGEGTGRLHMNGGTLDIYGPFSTAVPITLSNVSLIDTQGTTARLRGVISGGGILDLQANDVTFASTFSSAGPVTKTGSGTLEHFNL